MTNKKWFLNIDNHVTGPLPLKDLEKCLLTQPSALIWARGYSDWLTVPRWREKLQTEAKVLKTDEVTWKYRLDGVESHGLDFEKILLELKSYPKLDHVEIWSSKKKTWQIIFTVPEVADRLGISRRHETRVPIMGTYIGESAGGSFKCSVSTISEGGMGLTNCDIFKIGDNLKGVLSSSNLLIEISCFCEVVFVGQNGTVGLKFVSLPMEAKTVIIEYVRKFEET
jgi:hypothetical protein